MDRDEMMTWEGPERVFNEMAQKAAKWDRVKEIAKTRFRIECKKCSIMRSCKNNEGASSDLCNMAGIIIDALEESR